MPASNTLNRIIGTTQLANKLMREYMPHLVEDGWKFKISNTRNAVGRCDFDNKVIEVSKFYMHNSMDEVEDTIRHEIAHALAGPIHGHDHVWRRFAIDVGANPTRCAEAGVTFNGNYNYTVTCQNPHCPSGGWSHGKHRLKQGYMRYHCKHCGGPITVIDLKTGDIFKTTPSRIPGD